MVQTFQNLLPAIADDFAKPNVAVHGDKQSAIAQSGRLRVCHDIAIEQVVPNFHDFGFGAAVVHPQAFQHLRQDPAYGTAAERFGFFERRDIDAAPLAQNALVGRPFARTERRTGPIREREHLLRELNCFDQLLLWRLMLIEHEHAMGLEIVIARERIAGQKIMHRFIELEPHR